MAEKDSNLDQNPDQQTDPALRQKAGQVVSLVSIALFKLSRVYAVIWSATVSLRINST